MIPHLAIFTLAFMAFGASADSGPTPVPPGPVIGFFSDDNCGILQNGTTNNDALLGTFSPDVSTLEKSICNTDCLPIDILGYKDQVKTAGFLPNSGYVYGCFYWLVDGTGPPDKLCINEPPNINEAIGTGACSKITNVDGGPIASNIRVLCKGYPLAGNPTKPFINCPNDPTQ